MSRRRTTKHTGLEAAIREDTQGRAVAAVAERTEDTQRAMRAAGWDPKTRKRIEPASALTTHLIVDVTPDRPGARDAVRFACGFVSTRLNECLSTRDRTKVDCAQCLVELRERYAPNPLNGPTPVDLVDALESMILVAEDCQQRWSRGHAERVAAAREVLARYR